MNSGKKSQQSMADGIVSNLIHTNRIGRVVLKKVFKMGVDRFERIVLGRAKNISHSHLNGLQVTTVMMEKWRFLWTIFQSILGTLAVTGD